MVGNISDRQNDTPTSATTPVMLGETIAKRHSTTASEPRTSRALVALTLPITQVITNREIKNTIRLTCKSSPPSVRLPPMACWVYWMMKVQVQTWAATLKNWATT